MVDLNKLIEELREELAQAKGVEEAARDERTEAEQAHEVAVRKCVNIESAIDALIDLRDDKASGRYPL